MDTEKYKFVFILSFIVLILILTIAVIAAFWPKYEEQFIGLGLLGKNKTAGGYYPNDNPTIEADSKIDWYIYVNNHFGKSHDVSIKIKLLNFTMELPDDQKSKPSPLSPFIEFPLSLSIDESILIPFSWSILEMDSKNNYVILKKLMVNDQIIQLDVLPSLDSKFIMVFEIWVLDPSSQDYYFGWSNGNGLSSASNYIHFNVN